MDKLPVLALASFIVVGTFTWEWVYKWATGRDPEEERLKRLKRDPCFGPAYIQALKDDGGVPGKNTRLIVRTFERIG